MKELEKVEAILNKAQDRVVIVAHEESAETII